MGVDSNGIEYDVLLEKGNFTMLGEYTNLIWCNFSQALQGGFIEWSMYVNKVGQEPTTNESIIYIILAFGVLLLFAISFYFMIVTPYGNKKNEKGATIQITKLKYVKLGLILLTWVLFTWFLNILIGLSDNFVFLTMYYGFFGFMFQVMNALALPLGIIILVIAGIEIIRDINVWKLIKSFGEATR